VIGEANPAKDHIAFASAATTGFRRDHGEVTPASLALDACIFVPTATLPCIDDVHCPGELPSCVAGLCAKSDSAAAAPGTAPCGESGMTVIRSGSAVRRAAWVW